MIRTLRWSTLALVLLVPSAAAEPCPPQPGDGAFADEVCSVGILVPCTLARQTENFLNCRLGMFEWVPEMARHFVEELYRETLRLAYDLQCAVTIFANRQYTEHAHPLVWVIICEMGHPSCEDLLLSDTYCLIQRTWARALNAPPPSC